MHAFPRSAPSDPSAPHVTAARVTVDACCDRGPLQRIWASFGYDEINWTYTPHRQAAAADLRRLRRAAATTSARTTSSAAAAASACRTGAAATSTTRTPTASRTTTSPSPTRPTTRSSAPATTRWSSSAFTPRALRARRRPSRVRRSRAARRSYSAYEAGAWAYPPKDYAKWGGLVAALVAALPGALRRRTRSQLALGAVERARHLLLARHAGAVPRAVRRDGPGVRACCPTPRSAARRSPAADGGRSCAASSTHASARGTAAGLRLLPHQGLGASRRGAPTARSAGPAPEQQSPSARRCCARSAATLDG